MGELVDDKGRPVDPTDFLTKEGKPKRRSITPEQRTEQQLRFYEETVQGGANEVVPSLNPVSPADKESKPRLVYGQNLDPADQAEENVRAAIELQNVKSPK